jgi:hypothetical protein
MSVKDEYWYRGNWGAETAEHVPLAAAVMKIGPVVAGPDWTGDEGRDSGNYCWRRGIERGRAREDAARRGVRPDPTPLSARTAAEWLEASRRPASQPYVPGHFRLRAAQSELVRAAIWREIDTFYRAHGDIAMKSIPAEAWAAMAFDVVFEACRTDPDNYRTRDGSCPIFVSRTSLYSFCRSGEAGSVTASPAAPRKAKSGRTAIYDWTAAMQYGMELLRNHGGIYPQDPELPDLATFERLIAEHFAEKDQHPSESLIRKHATKWVREFGEAKKEG